MTVQVAYIKAVHEQRGNNLRDIIYKSEMPKRFTLELEEGAHVFLPGQTVNGTVVLELERPKKLHAIQVNLVGWVEVLSETFSAKKQFLEDSVTVWSKPETEVCGTLPAGLHSLPFTFSLPDHIPPSLENDGDCGKIRYRLYAKIKSGKIWGCEADKRLRIVELVNCKKPTLQSPAHGVHKVDQSVLFTTCSMVLNVEIPRTGYKQQESVPLTIGVDGCSSKVSLSACLIRKATAGVHGALTIDCEKVARISLKSCKPAENGSTVLWAPDLIIPNTDPTLTSDIINVNYYVQVTAKSYWRPKLTVEIPVTIGNVSV